MACNVWSLTYQYNFSLVSWPLGCLMMIADNFAIAPPARFTNPREVITAQCATDVFTRETITASSLVHVLGDITCVTSYSSAFMLALGQYFGSRSMLITTLLMTI